MLSTTGRRSPRLARTPGVADELRRHARLGHALLLRAVLQEPSDPVDVRAFGSVGIVARSQARAQLLERGQWACVALLVHDRAGRLAMPLGSLEEVDEVDTERLIRLTHLPVFGAAVLLQFFAETPHLIREGFVRGWGDRNRRTQRTKYGAAAGRTNCALSRNSPNCCSEDSSSRMRHLGIHRARRVPRRRVCSVLAVPMVARRQSAAYAVRRQLALPVLATPVAPVISGNGALQLTSVFGGNWRRPSFGSRQWRLPPIDGSSGKRRSRQFPILNGWSPGKSLWQTLLRRSQMAAIIAASGGWFGA